MNLLIETADLTMEYTRGHVALGPLSLSVHRDCHIIGLIGPNGAGKTTLVRILGGQLLPTAGSACVLGFDVINEVQALRERIAFLPQEVAAHFYTLTPRDYIYFYQRFRGFGTKQAKSIVAQALEEFALEDICTRPIMELSSGQVRKTLLAMVLSCPDAELYFVDEPTVGLDPRARQHVWEIIRQRTAKGAFIILTSHYMDEISSLASQVLLLSSGRLVAQGRLEELINKVLGSLGKKKVIVNAELPSWVQEMAAVYTVGEKHFLYTDSLEELCFRLAQHRIAFVMAELGADDLFVYLTDKQFATRLGGDH